MSCVFIPTPNGAKLFSTRNVLLGKFSVKTLQNIFYSNMLYVGYETQFIQDAISDS